MEITLTRDNFDSTAASGKPLLIDFWATWCGPCRMIAPVVEKIASERQDIAVCKCDVDQQPELANRFGVEVIPTLVVLRGGREVARTMGYKDHATLSAFIDGALK